MKNLSTILRFKIYVLKNINLSDYTYDLPNDRIAKYGLTDRDQSKLIYYHNQQVEHKMFYNLPDLLPPDSTLFFNNTKVIQARLILKRLTGALIEVFLLNPINALESIFDTLNSKDSVQYHCMIGNLKKWKEGEVLEENIEVNGEKTRLHVKLIDKDKHYVDFSWDNDKINFSAILEVIGHTPLPPYLNRPDEEGDKERYQTVFSKKPGAVAAPTAGLHFTPEILSQIKKKGVKSDFLTLHVSAGTFQPIKTENITDHPMHSEQIIITKSNLINLLKAERIIPVGTTAMRTLESTYWFGVQLVRGNKIGFRINKLEPYNQSSLPSKKEALNAVLNHLDTHKLDELRGKTEIFIFPGYKFRVCDGLITNFHQPGSTLILLVAAFIGSDWKRIYSEALENDYRFLSYGDSSLLIP